LGEKLVTESTELQMAMTESEAHQMADHAAPPADVDEAPDDFDFSIALVGGGTVDVVEDVADLDFGAVYAARCN
jgi:hypothetical protein